MRAAFIIKGLRLLEMEGSEMSIDKAWEESTQPLYSPSSTYLSQHPSNEHWNSSL